MIKKSAAEVSKKK